MRPSAFAVIAAGILTACASTIMRGPAPAPNVAVQTWAEDLPDQGAVQIYLRNDSKVDHIITALQIFNCENVRQDCKTYEPNVVVPAGKIVKAMRLSRVSLTQGWKYQYTFRSRPVSAPVSASATLPGVIRPVEVADPELLVPRVEAIEDQAGCRVMADSPTPGSRQLMLTFPATSPEQHRIVVVDLDAESRPVRYADQRGNLGVRPDDPRLDSLPPRSNISVEIGHHTALLVNQGGGKPKEYFLSRGPAVMTAVSLGNPRAMIARALKDCGITP